MNSASDPLDLNSQAPPFGGVPRGREGLILQRGGEELVLRKSRDRFTIAPQYIADPTPNAAAANYRHSVGLDRLLRSLPIVERLPIPGKALQEIQISSNQLEAAMDRNGDGIVDCQEFARASDMAQLLSRVEHPGCDVIHPHIAKYETVQHWTLASQQDESAAAKLGAVLGAGISLVALALM